MNQSPDNDLHTQLRLARSGDTPPDVLAALAQSSTWRVCHFVAKNPNTPIEALMRLSLRTRLQLAMAGDTPPETLAALAGNPDAQVRYFAGKNPNMPVEMLARLLTDKGRCDSGPVFAAVLNNPRTPPEFLARFVEHREASVRRLLASNPNIPSEWLSRLAGDKDTKVRHAVAENPGTPLATLMRFAGNKDPGLRGYVAAHPQMPGNILATLAEDKEGEVRENVARNPQTPGDILAVLAEDTDASVRRAAFETLKRRTLKRSAKRESATERDFAQAVRSFKFAEHERALKLAHKAARNGSARAQYFLGILYEHGFVRGLAHDRERKGEKERAAYWLQKAADSGYKKKARVCLSHAGKRLSAELFAAEMFVNPDNPRRDDFKAAEYYRRTADGDPRNKDRYGRSCAVLAMKFLLELYDAGRGIAADTDLWLMERAARGDRLAMPALSRLFAGSRGVSRERKSAIRRLKKALQESKDKEVLKYGAYDGYDESDENAARFELGLSCLEGCGVKRDDAQAARWLARAAERDHDEAQLMMGHLHREGRGVEQNAAEAVRWYRKACERSGPSHVEIDQERLDSGRRTADSKAWAATHALLREEAERGNVDACYVLGVLYLDGMGVEKNSKRAAFWIRKAALAGSEDAQYLFGNLAAAGVGMARNPKAALRWHEKAAEKSFFYSDYAGCFGLDLEEQIRWLRRQTRKGNALAPHELAYRRFYRKTPARRVALLHLAAERGNMSAEYELGLACCSGDGVKQDYVQAAYWFQRASVNPEPNPHSYYKGPDSPQSELAHLYREGKGVERNPVLAAYWYETSLHDANCCSELALAMAYECGDGVEADIEKARYLYACVDSMRKGADELAAFFLELMDNAAGGA
ncbi:MAG: sel1 repeat family protein [Candidatus Accumulibacter sp.]|jgi:TPR repeat protein|nr:sel1 repeat family protein [Accumulibacter sp.]